MFIDTSDKSIILLATDHNCNALSRHSQLQCAWESVAASCSQWQSVADFWHWQIFFATIRHIARHRSMYAGELQFASKRTHQNVFYVTYIFGDEGVLVHCVACQCSMCLVQLQIFETGWEWICVVALQSVVMCMRGYIVTIQMQGLNPFNPFIWIYNKSFTIFLRIMYSILSF